MKWQALEEVEGQSETQHQTPTIKHERKISGGLSSRHIYAYMCVMFMDVCIFEDVNVYISLWWCVEKNVAYAAISAYRSLSFAFFAHHSMRSFFVQTNENVNSNANFV